MGGALVATLFLVMAPLSAREFDPVIIAAVVLVVNSAHFAASTVRLYGGPGYREQFPGLSMLFPLVTIAVLAVTIAYPESLGRHLQALYLTWSPFHYARQTYGMSLMYFFRSGCRLGDLEKRLLLWSCLLPFLRSFLGALNSGLGWLVPRSEIMSTPYLPQVLNGLAQLLLVATFVAPALLLAGLWMRRRARMPAPALILMFSNGLWWTGLDYLDAFVIATVAHGLQYLAIMLVYHVSEKLREPGNTRGWLYHAARFYAICLVLGYGLFYCWPYAFVWAGAGLAESMLLVTATVNIHHFVVDAFIWRLRSAVNSPTRVGRPSAGAEPIAGGRVEVQR